MRGSGKVQVSWGPKRGRETPAGGSRETCVSRLRLEGMRSNQSILKEINPEYSLEGVKLKLKLQYFGHLMWRTDSLENTLMLGKTEGRRRRGLQRMRWLDGITEFEQAPGIDDGQRSLVCCSPWGRKELDKTEWLNWTESMCKTNLGKKQELLEDHPWVYMGRGWDLESSIQLSFG